MTQEHVRQLEAESARLLDEIYRLKQFIGDVWTHCPWCGRLLPKRVQRKRTRGWKMPEGAIYVGRPTKWGNPLKLGQRIYWDEREFVGATRADCVAFYREWVRWQFTEEEIRRELGGKDLVCWCSSSDPCHADVLLRLANV